MPGKIDTVVNDGDAVRWNLLAKSKDIGHDTGDRNVVLGKRPNHAIEEEVQVVLVVSRVPLAGYHVSDARQPRDKGPHHV